jgi:predicted acylesterase/phospholipase RssA
MDALSCTSKTASSVIIKKGCCSSLEGADIDNNGCIRYSCKLAQDSKDSDSSDLSRDDTVQAVKKSAMRIFSADGGGVRGKFTITLAARLEKELGSHLKLGEIFDVFGGTSTGAITALLLNKPSTENSKLPLYSARHINDKFDEVAAEIFPNNLCARISKFVNYYICNDAKYSKQGIHHCFDKYLGDVLLKDSVNEIVVPTYQLGPQMNTWFITRKMAREKPFFYELSMKKMLLMTTAAPTYFHAEKYKGLYFIDGGIFANDPAEAAWITAKNTFGSHSNYVICSLGTGIAPTKFDNHPSYHPGVYTIAPDIIDLFMNASEQSINQNMLDAFAQQKGYYRWQSQIKKVELDDSSPENLAYLEDQAHALLDDPKNQEQWEEMLTELRKAENTEPHAYPVQLYS